MAHSVCINYTYTLMTSAVCVKREVEALKELCMRAGVTEEEIQNCTPRSTCMLYSLTLSIEVTIVTYKISRKYNINVLGFTTITYRRLRFRAKLQYTDTGYEHQLRTPTNTTNGQKFATPQHLDMLCWAVVLRRGKFVVELLCACPLVVSGAGVRSRCPCSGVWLLLNDGGDDFYSERSRLAN